MSSIFIRKTSTTRNIICLNHAHKVKERQNKVILTYQVPWIFARLNIPSSDRMVPWCWINCFMLRPNHRWYTLCMPNNGRYSLSLMAQKIVKNNVCGMPGKKYRCNLSHKVQHLRTLLYLFFLFLWRTTLYLFIYSYEFLWKIAHLSRAF